MNIIIPDIDPLIIAFLDIPELAQMVATNKYFCGIINQNQLYQQHCYMQKNCIRHRNIYALFVIACKKGYLPYAKSLIRRHSNNINIHMAGEYPFQLCCASGNFSMCQWMLSLDKINIHDDNELAFLWSCKYGYFEIIKWLINLGEQSYGKIDIHTTRGTYDAFGFACNYNRLEIAQYLLHLGENCGYGKINVHRIKIYQECVTRGHTNIINWLLTLEQSYGVFIKG